MAIAKNDKGNGDQVREDVSDIVSDIKDMVGIPRADEGAVKRFLKDLSRAPAPKQIGVGAAVGWVAGYATMKVGKMAATAIGGSLLLLQIAHHKGYVNVNWNAMSRDTATLADRVKEKLKVRSKSGVEKMADFARDNVYVAGGFTGGFFLGIASS